MTGSQNQARASNKIESLQSTIKGNQTTSEAIGIGFGKGVEEKIKE